jgi:hypothetical protein
VLVESSGLPIFRAEEALIAIKTLDADAIRMAQ